MTYKKNNDIVDKAETAVIDERTIRNKIYVVRGIQVMLDFELAEIYGYTTSAFNQQVKRNEERFPLDFRFQLTQEELDNLSKSQNVILNKGSGRGSNIKYLPWAFTEQGVYMLMTVLKGKIAVDQSIALVLTFRAMKDYIIRTQFPNIPVTFITTQKKLHDRFIVLDYNTADERALHCGPSSKDAGNKLCAITEFSDGTVKKSLHDAVTNMLGNPVLTLI